jgi:hypothetical protein
VKPSRSEAIWQRFRSACDAFFERYKHRDQLALSELVGAREAVCQDLEALHARVSGAPERRAAAVGGGAPDAGGTGRPENPADAEAHGAADAGIGREASGAVLGEVAVSQADVTATPQRPSSGELQKMVLDSWFRWQQAPRVPWNVAEPLEKRFEAALLGIIASAPEAFKGTRLDVEANAKKMEDLCAQVEGLDAGRVTATDIASAPAETLATMLKDALATNTLGGRADEDAKRRAAANAVKDAQNAWRRLGPVPGERGRQLTARFNRACRRFFDHTRATPAAPPPRPTHA